jgi:hypothetical protein
MLLGSFLISQMHLTWTCFVFRSSRQCSHWVTGRPFFFISKSGRSVCLHAEDLCPLMQVSLIQRQRGGPQREPTGGGGAYQAYFLLSMKTCRRWVSGAAGTHTGGLPTMVGAYMRWRRPAKKSTGGLVGREGGEELLGVFNHHLRCAGRTIRVC